MRGGPKGVEFINGMAKLPNGDLWLGHERTRVAEPNVPAVSAPENVDDALAQMIVSQVSAAKYECVWCGMQFEKQQIGELRSHIEGQHKSVIGNEGENAALEAALNEALSKEK